MLVVVCGPSGAQEPERPPFLLDPASGEIDGQRAVAVYPTRYEDGRFVGILAPAGCEAHFVPSDDPDTELVFPCGEWFLPPGRHRYWLWVEQGWRMSPYASRMVYSGGRFEGRGMVGFIPIAEGGRLTLPPEMERSPEQVLRLWRAAPHIEGDLPREQLWRQKRAAEVGDGLLMPAGPAIGALWDTRLQRYTALSRPVTVAAGRTVEVPLEEPGKGADLLVRLTRASRARRISEYDVELALVRAGQELEPDVQVPSAGTVLAVWYGLDPGPIELRADSPREGTPPKPLDLQAGRIEYLEGELKPRPALDVELNVPAELDDEDGEELVLEVRRLPESPLAAEEATGGPRAERPEPPAADPPEPVARQELPPGSRFHRFERLPLTVVEVALVTPAGTFTGTIDLTSGEDGHLLLEPPLVVLTGTVYLGGDGHPATLTFDTVRRKSIEAQADEEGAYQAVCPEPVRFASIDLEGREGAPYVEFFSPAIDASSELDFHVSDAEVWVRVLDATTGEGIPGASVSFRSHFAGREEDGEEAAERGLGSAVAQRAETDAEGLALLPPPRPGRIELRAAAEGYYEMGAPVEVLLDGSTGQRIEIALEPSGKAVQLRLSLPGGAPAAGAQVALVDSLATGRLLLTAQADAEGTVDLPGRAKGVVVMVRHPGAAFLVRDWPQSAVEEVAWDLPRASLQPLAVQVLGERADEVVPRAELALWVRGERLSGAVLTWLTGERPTADRGGSWSAANLPPGQVAILAWTPRVREEAYRGGLDALATAVGYPWPEVVEVRAVQ